MQKLKKKKIRIFSISKTLTISWIVWTKRNYSKNSFIKYEQRIHIYHFFKTFGCIAKKKERKSIRKILKLRFEGICVLNGKQNKISRSWSEIFMTKKGKMIFRSMLKNMRKTKKESFLNFQIQLAYIWVNWVRKIYEIYENAPKKQYLNWQNEGRGNIEVLAQWCNEKWRGL